MRIGFTACTADADRCRKCECVSIILLIGNKGIYPLIKKIIYFYDIYANKKQNYI